MGEESLCTCGRVTVSTPPPHWTVGGTRRRREEQSRKRSSYLSTILIVFRPKYGEYGVVNQATVVLVWSDLSSDSDPHPARGHGAQSAVSPTAVSKVTAAVASTLLCGKQKK